MHRVYLTVYKPNMNTENPYLYIGSTCKSEDSGYLGSVKSKEWKEFWERETKKNPESFDHFTLSWHETREQALKEELSVQKSMNVVKDSRFFNKSYATKDGMMGMDVSGSNNPMYGRSRKGHKVGGAVSPKFGKDNPMFGNDWRVGKTAEELIEHSKKSARNGSDNGCFGSSFMWINKNGQHKRHDKNSPIPAGWSKGFTKTTAMQEVRKRAVKCIETGIIYKTIVEAAIKTNSHGSKISLCCAGKRKKTNGFSWEYVTNKGN
jgi:hypothetical protein